MKALDIDPEVAHAALWDLPAEDVVRWARQTFGEQLVLSSSFGAHAAVMLHLATRVWPEIPVVLVDTGYLFDETYQYVRTLRERLDLRLHVATPALTAAHQEALHGRLWDQGEEGVRTYLRINKVEPMQRALRELGAKAWLAGLRADQTEHRAGLRHVERQGSQWKVHPILRWSLEEVEQYMRVHDLPPHPLYEQGYRSIGDWHSTLPTAPGQDPREGRMLGKKKECGLHLPLGEDANASLTSSGL